MKCVKLGGDVYRVSNYTAERMVAEGATYVGKDAWKEQNDRLERERRAGMSFFAKVIEYIRGKA